MPSDIAAVHARKLRCPAPDWADIIAGVKTEFRMAGGVLLPQHVTVPQPVVAWCTGYSSRKRLMILEDCRSEELLSISPQSLEREGFSSIDEFRAYWRGRYSGFKPLDKVMVYRVRPMQRAEREAWAMLLFDRLFGDAP